MMGRPPERTNSCLVKRQILEIAEIAAIEFLRLDAGVLIARLDQKHAAPSSPQFYGERDSSNASANDAGIKYGRQKIRAVLGKIDQHRKNVSQQRSVSARIQPSI